MGITIRLFFFMGIMAVALFTWFGTEWYWDIPIWILIILGAYQIVNFVAKD